MAQPESKATASTTTHQRTEVANFICPSFSIEVAGLVNPNDYQRAIGALCPWLFVANSAGENCKRFCLTDHLPLLAKARVKNSQMFSVGAGVRTKQASVRIRTCRTCARLLASGVLVWIVSGSRAEAATLLSSLDLPGATATSTGGGSFSSSPSPRAASVPMIGGISEPAPAPAPEPRVATSAEPTRSKPRATARSEESRLKQGQRTSTSATKSRKADESAEDVSTNSPVEQPAEPPAQATALVTTTRSLWTTDFGWSWFNKYYFRGVDVLKAVSPSTTDSGVFSSKVTMAISREKDAFSIGFGYVEALQRQLPRGAAANVPPNSSRKDNEKFGLPPSERYSEYNFYLAYSRQLIAKKLQATLGYNHYHFGDGTFWQSESGPIRYANEATLRLDYIGLPIVRPSVTWAHDFDGFKGDYVEMRLDTGFDLTRRGNFGVRVEPYVALSYDFAYNGANNGWNALETGLSIPIHLNDHFTLTFTGTYTKDLEASRGQARVNEGFWGGVVFNAAWGGSTTSQALFGTGSYKNADKMLTVPADPNPWEFSAGAGWRQFNFDFNHRSISRFNTSNVFQPRAGRGAGSIPFDDGTVFAGQAPVNSTGNAGLADFRINSATQVLGSIAAGNAQVRFTNTDFGYQTRSQESSTNSDDQDSVAFPYISMDRELWRNNFWSIRAGLSYAFAHSEGDSGVRLARLDSLFQQTNRFGTLFTLDPLGTNVTPGNNFDSRDLRGGQFASVIVDPIAFSNSVAAIVTPQVFQSLRNSGPQSEFQSTNTEVARVATFVRTKVSVTSNDIAIPITLRHDFGKRLHAELNVGPTLTFASGNLTTDVQRRALVNRQGDRQTANQRAAARATSVALNANQPPGAFVNPAFFNSATFTSNVDRPAAQTSSGNKDVQSQNSAGNANLGSGKTNNTKDPEYPGKRIDRKTYSDSTNEFLFGADAGLSVVYDLNEEGTFFAEVWGRYHWVESYTLDNGLGSVKIDPSGFEAGIGVGVRF